MKEKRIIILLKVSIWKFSLLFLLSQPLVSQIATEGIPASMAAGIKYNPEFILLPGMDQREMVKSREEAMETASKHKTLPFAKIFEVSYTPGKHGNWDLLPNGTWVWRMGIVSPNAYSIGLKFDRYHLPEGAKMYIYNASNEYISGAFTSVNNKKSGILSVYPVPGEAIIIELNIPDALIGEYELELGQVSHDYLGIYSMDSKDGFFGDSGPCNIDINCPPGNAWQLEKRSVVRLLVDGTYICSGVMVNNTAEDGIPYLYTANHCVAEGQDAALLVIFNYESAYCSGPDGSVTQSISGTMLRATSGNLDFTLVELSVIPPVNFKPYYSGWKNVETGIESTTSIHHAEGDVKKISIDKDSPVTGTYSDFQDTYDDNAHWIVQSWEQGTTEAGSSGGPLFNQNGQVIGVLTGGDAFCGYSVNDYYAKTARSWDDYTPVNQQLKAWLDPVSTGSNSILGFNPYGSQPLQADFLISAGRVCQGEPLVFNDLSSGDIASWTWDFGPGSTPQDATGPGPHYVMFDGPGDKNIRLIVSDASTSDTLDVIHNVVYDNQVIADFTYSARPNNWIDFTDNSTNGLTYYWEFGDIGTSTAKDPSHRYASLGNYQVAEVVKNTTCRDTAINQVLVTHNPAVDWAAQYGLKVYPQPVGEILNVELEDPDNGMWTLTLRDLTGILYLTKSGLIMDGTCKIKISEIPPGIFLLTLKRDNVEINRKIIKLK